MDLVHDYIEPAELSGYARAHLSDLEVNRFRLAAFLPSVPVDDLQYRYTKGGEGLAEAVPFRAYDAEASIGGRKGTSRVTGELPPLSRKIRLGEYDRLRLRKADAAIVNAIKSDAKRITEGIAARIELARGEALCDGQVTLDENGVSATIDFGRDSTMEPSSPSVLWNASSGTPDPIEDISGWVEDYVTKNGQRPAVALTSSKVRSAMLRNSGIRQLLKVQGTAPSIVTVAALNDLLQSFDLPPVAVYDAQAVDTDGSTVRVIDADKFLMLPGDPGAMGATLWGTTSESLEPEYGLGGGDEPGIALGVYKDNDPLAHWTKGVAIAVPILANPDLAFAVTVTS